MVYLMVYKAMLISNQVSAFCIKGPAAWHFKMLMFEQNYIVVLNCLKPLNVFNKSEYDCSVFISFMTYLAI